MAQRPPIVKDGLLTYPQGGSSAQVEVDSADWYTWLETASSFTFRSEYGSLAERKEQVGNRRGSLYWRAYCTREGKMQRYNDILYRVFRWSIGEGELYRYLRGES
jgi:hypothetical protein